MLALAAIWKALHELRHRGWWLAAASLAYGLAVGARPSLLFGAVILLVPVAQAWRERRKIWVALMAASGPIVLIGLGLMLYNALRFDSPFEFGMRYQLAGGRVLTQQFFSLRYLWFNFRVYFIEPARWGGQFPFVHDITMPPSLAGQGQVEHPFGVFTNIPLVWLALAVPLAWRGRSAESRSNLCGFVTVLAALFGICALTMCLLFCASTRYEVEFLPWLVLLAVIGVLSLERALAYRPVWQRAARCGWGLLLGFSMAFNLLASVERRAESHYNLGCTLEVQGKLAEAIAQYEQALRLNPTYAEAHRILGNHLLESGKVLEAITHLEQTVRFNPDWAEAHNNLAAALMLMGKLPEAAEHFKQSLRIDPDVAEAHSNLAGVLVQLGHLPEALEQFEQALRIRPDDAEIHYDFGRALEQTGRMQEAKGHYEEALRLKPDSVDAQKALARLRAAQ
jgi:tetratricopeptide (TPR) repeat protein